MLIDYKVDRTEDCALMNVNNWISTSDIVSQNIKGKLSISCITEILEENFKEDYGVHKGDYVLITKVASDIAVMRSYSLTDNSKYFNLPISQIIGRFKGNNVSLTSLELLKGKVLIEKVTNTDSYLYLPETSDMVGKVIKVNSGIDSIRENGLILLKDNIITPIRLDGKEYFAADDTNVVGVISHDGIKFINESILMVPYVSPYVLGSELLVSPTIDYENLDYSDIYNRDLFQIKFLDENLIDFKKDDIILVRRDLTTYVYIDDNKYFLLNGKKWVEAKLEGKKG